MLDPTQPILVTGAAGFIGYHVCERLLGAGHRVVGLDNLSPYYDPTLKEARLARLQKHPGFAFHRLDLTDRAGVAALFAAGAEGQPFGTVIHLAAQAGVRHSLSHPHDYVEANVTGTLTVLEGCRHSGAKHLVLASTSSVYGLDRRIPFEEAHAAHHPMTIYAATKLATEAMAHSYAHLYGLPSTVLRFFTVYGPWGRPDMALFTFTKAMLAGEPIQVFGEGAQARDFTYVDDVVTGVLGAAAHPPKGGEGGWTPEAPDAATSSAPWRVLNLGATRKVPLMRFIEVLEDALGVKAKKELLPMQPGDVPETHADTGRLSALTGYAPETPVEVGVARFVEWYREYYGR
jgi:UDP-glucuronate 4-epimerase